MTSSLLATSSALIILVSLEGTGSLHQCTGQPTLKLKEMQKERKCTWSKLSLIDQQFGSTLLNQYIDSILAYTLFTIQYTVCGIYLLSGTWYIIENIEKFYASHSNKIYNKKISLLIITFASISLRCFDLSCH